MLTPLLTDIDQFLADFGMSDYRFGILAANNGRLLERMRQNGKRGRPGRVWPETEQQIRNFMAVYRHEKAKRKAA